ncbi:MAG: hypothetical protein FWF24_04825 [Alphaproteobacteria bacterium]|nr:hypothetical protein [Alphaproteobacteria bacterium]
MEEEWLETKKHIVDCNSEDVFVNYIMTRLHGFFFLCFKVLKPNVLMGATAQEERLDAFDCWLSELRMFSVSSNPQKTTFLLNIKTLEDAGKKIEEQIGTKGFYNSPTHAACAVFRKIASLQKLANLSTEQQVNPPDPCMTRVRLLHEMAADFGSFVECAALHERTYRKTQKLCSIDSSSYTEKEVMDDEMRFAWHESDDDPARQSLTNNSFLFLENEANKVLEKSMAGEVPKKARAGRSALSAYVVNLVGQEARRLGFWGKFTRYRVAEALQKHSPLLKDYTVKRIDQALKVLGHPTKRTGKRKK